MEINEIGNENSSMTNHFYHLIEEFLRNVTAGQIKRYLDTKIVGQDNAKKAATSLLYEHLYRLRYDKTYKKQNLMLVGPSGCGKTEIMRQLKKVSPVNITIFDASSITQEGWKGEVKVQSIGEKVMVDCMKKYNALYKSGLQDDISMIQTLINSSIVVLDEFDKVVRPRYSSNAENVSVSLMGEMLKLFEDGEYKASIGPNTRPLTINYSKIPIIALGAFSEMTSPKKTANALGFCAETEEEANDETGDKQFTTDDLIGYGLTHELAGRIQHIVTLSPLTKEDMIAIIKSNNSCVEECSNLLRQMYRIELRFTEAAYEDIAEEALRNHTGARALGTCLLNLKEKIIWNVPTDSIVTVTSRNTYKNEDAEYIKKQWGETY